MQKPIALLLLLTLVALAGDRKTVAFRLKRDPGVRLKAYCLSADEEGMDIERIGSRKRERISWDDIVESDTRRLRIDFKLELTEDEKKGLIPGQEVFFRGGMSVRGIVEKKDEENNQIVIRTDGMILPYPLDRVDRIEKVKIQEAEAYDEQEIYVMRLKNRPPTNWGDHRRLARRSSRASPRSRTSSTTRARCWSCKRRSRSRISGVATTTRSRCSRSTRNSGRGRSAASCA